MTHVHGLSGESSTQDKRRWTNQVSFADIQAKPQPLVAAVGASLQPEIPRAAGGPRGWTAVLVLAERRSWNPSQGSLAWTSELSLSKTTVRPGCYGFAPRNISGSLRHLNRFDLWLRSAVPLSLSTASPRWRVWRSSRHVRPHSTEMR